MQSYTPTRRLAFNAMQSSPLGIDVGAFTDHVTELLLAMGFDSAEQFIQAYMWDIAAGRAAFLATAHDNARSHRTKRAAAGAIAALVALRGCGPTNSAVVDTLAAIADTMHGELKQAIDTHRLRTALAKTRMDPVGRVWLLHYTATAIAVGGTLQHTVHTITSDSQLREKYIEYTSKR